MTAAYVTDTQDIQDFIPDLTLGASSTPTLTRVERFIARREGQLNVALKRAGYDVPLTTANDVAFCAQLVTQVVVFDTWTAAYGMSDIPTAIQEYWLDWNKALKDIAEGDTYEFESSSALGENDPSFGIARFPTRDTIFTERYNTSDWDE